MNRALPIRKLPNRILHRLPAAVAVLLALAVLAAAPAVAAAADAMWLHVSVDEGEGGARVRVNLPLSMAETALAMIPEEELHNGRIQIEDEDFSLADLRRLWSQLDESPDATFVEVEEADGRVLVSKSGGYLLVKAYENDGQVDVRIPGGVVDALLSGEGEEIDLAAAIRALAEFGAGELVTVHDDATQVRVWVDNLSEMAR